MMAIAGLQNLSVVESSILRESRMPSSLSSGQNGNQGAGGSRASLILQMWRELEDEFLANRGREMVGGRLQNGSSDGLSSSVTSSNLPQNQESQNSIGLEGSIENESVNETVGEDSMASQAEQMDHHSTTLEQSQDLGEVERKRVREIFQEWMSTGGNGLTSPGPNTSSSPRTQLLGQTEIGRIRVVREWIQMACEQRDSSGSIPEEQVAEIGSQIERVREGLFPYNNEFQANNRRDIRRLCGRQALIDLLQNNKQERERELQVLVEHSPVRNFAYRNRIQSLLRIRMLHNRGSVENNRTNTAAESELGILRQRQTVSGLREGFLSRLQNNVHVQENEHSNSLPNNDTSAFRENETQANSSVEVVDNEHNEDCSSVPSSNCTEDLLCGSEINLEGGRGHIEASLAHDVVDNDRQQALTYEISRTTDPEDTGNGIWQVITPESSEHLAGEQAQLEETNQAHSNLGDEELQLHHDSLSNAEAVQFAGTDGTEDRNGELRLLISQDASRHENVEHGQLEDIHESIHEQHTHDNEDQDPLDMPSHSVYVDDQESEDARTRDSNTQGEVMEDEGQEWVESSSLNEWRDGDQEEPDQEEWRDGASDESFHDNTREMEGREQSQLEGSFRHESGPQQTLENWSALPSVTGVSSMGRADMYYYSDDDNAHNIELRELLSRRRVSSLLRSGFRESLDQLIQSYVERQSHAPVDWELHEMLSPSFVAQDQDRVNANDNEDSNDVDGHSDIIRSTSVNPPHRNWEQLHDFSWSRDMHQRPGTELEMINDLRIEMARLQQRLNHMQRMLEACMDMQLELQRSVRQEVSAALNRSINSTESDEPVISLSGSRWDCVKRGICCICCESNIDSLLYRCGHMCTCSKCAGVLVDAKGKCPMCQAPVLEVIRAYTIQ